ncbi:MAG TPA: hypothetical protein PLT93_17425, partial [Phycisphaerae bacterium]|nr:hypothetical protein [Phycisphaerae bacterium]
MSVATVALLVLIQTAPATAESAKAIEAALAERIVAPGVTLEEVRRFIEACIPNIPKVESVADWEQAARRMRHETLEKVVLRGRAVEWRDAD